MSTDEELASPSFRESCILIGSRDDADDKDYSCLKWLKSISTDIIF